MKEILPVPYFHVVFTLPHQLNSIVLRNKKPFYNLMFKAVSETLLTLARDPKYLGGEIGFTAILHSWGQNLMDHYHIHCIVPGGVYKDRWKTGKSDFLFPVPVMQKLFRGKCMDYFRKALSNGSINPLFTVTLEYKTIDDLINKLYTIKWVVNVRKPFASPLNLVKYLSYYTQRIAITNKRIIEIKNGQVTFSYKDYADNSKRKYMTISAVEFIRRFMLHIVPEGFMRIRQYGFLSNKKKKERLGQIRMAINENAVSIENQEQKPITTVKDLMKEIFQCPSCKQGTLYKYKVIAPIEINNEAMSNN